MNAHTKTKIDKWENLIQNFIYGFLLICHNQQNSSTRPNKSEVQSSLKKKYS